MLGLRPETEHKVRPSEPQAQRKAEERENSPPLKAYDEEACPQSPGRRRRKPATCADPIPV